MQTKLFDIPQKEKSTNKCKTCEHFQRWECNSKIFFYCGIRKSNRTSNKQQKIKANQTACENYKNV